MPAVVKGVRSWSGTVILGSVPSQQAVGELVGAAGNRIEREMILDLVPQVFTEACPGVVTNKPDQERAEPASQRITFHFTPASCSWLNMVEVFFGIITRQAIRRGTFRNVKDLTGAIGRFIDAYNQRCQPFAWTKAPDRILAGASRRSPRAPGDGTRGTP